MRLNQAHSVGIAKDLNKLDGDIIEGAAGTAIPFDEDLLAANVREAILRTAAATLGTAEDVVLFGTSAALALVNGYAPNSAANASGATSRVFGARLYVHEEATAGVVTAFNPRAFRVFADRLRSASTIDPKSGGHLFGSWLHSTEPGVGVVGGAAAVEVFETS
jgi:hypothetical protein